MLHVERRRDDTHVHVRIKVKLDAANLPVPILAIRAQLLEEGGPPMWDDPRLAA